MSCDEGRVTLRHMVLTARSKTARRATAGERSRASRSFVRSPFPFRQAGRVDGGRAMVCRAALCWAVVYGITGLAAALTGSSLVRFGPASGPAALDWAVVATAGVAGAGAAAVVRPWGRRFPATVVLTLLLGAAAACVAGSFGLLMELITLVFNQQVDSPLSAAHQVLAAVGAVLLIGAARVFRDSSGRACPRCAAVHDAPARLVRPAPGPAPRSVRWTAYAGCAAFLPYIAMKTAWALGATFAGVTGADILSAAREQGSSGVWPTLEAWGVDPTALCAALGILLLLGLVRPWGQALPRWTPFLAGRRVPRWLPLAPALLGAATLAPYGLVGIGYAALGSAGLVTVPRGDFPSSADALKVIWCGLGGFCGYGLALAVATRSYLVRTRRCCAPVTERREAVPPASGSVRPPATTGRLRAAWRAAHAPVPGVPRWARVAAYAVPFAVLPSGLWRIAEVVFHVPLNESGSGGAGDLPSWLPPQAYVILLSVVSELLAFTAVGLIASWGQTFPRWIPRLRGRAVPVPVAVVPAALGAATLTVLWTTTAVLGIAGRTLQGRPLPEGNPLTFHGWHLAVFVLCYAPLLLWGPLLAALTVAYRQRRHRATATGVHPAGSSIT